ncbi:hypothetical protein [Streptomyces sp. NPDC051567]|uniref:hypothetical protein n=1 Tax=Streptomyces sp. NPDC051567 TaxID=3365660 RepID=UPI00379A1761
MRRYRYRCTICRTTSPTVHRPADLETEGHAHRHSQHGGHYPDDELAGRIDRRGRWYETLHPLTATHAHLADALSDLHDPKTLGHYWWASAGAALILTTAAALVLGILTTALHTL